MTTFKKWDGKTFPVSGLTGTGERVTWVSGVRARTEASAGTVNSDYLRTDSGKWYDVTISEKTVRITNEDLIRQLESV